MDSAQSTPSARTRVKLPPDPYNDDSPRLGRRRPVLVLVGTLAVLLVAIALVDRGGRASPNAQSPSQPTANVSDAAVPTSVTAPFQASGLPSGSADHIPIGYPHSVTGAESAAANYVVAYGSASMVQADARHRLVAAIADPAIASSLQSQLDSTFITANAAFGLSADGSPPTGLTFVARAAPIGVSLVNQTGNSATVAVWAVSLSGLAGQGSTHPVTENWSTVTVTLHWTSGDWKWVSFSSSDGPAPVGGQQTPANGQALQNAANLFGGLRYAR